MKPVGRAHQGFDRTERMRVVINAQLDPQTAGGIAQVLAGLARGFTQTAAAWPDADEFLFVCSPESAEWLSPYVGGPVRVVVNQGVKLPPSRGARVSDGFFESFRPDVVHFPYQSFTRVSMATVFNPHDLQHRHYPQFFATEEIDRREALFGDALRLADVVAVGTRWVQDDVARQFGADGSKVRVIPWGSPGDFLPQPVPGEVSAVLARLDLLPGFALYPAQTWPHKNHLRLLEAMEAARSAYGRCIRLVCCGHRTPHFDELRRRVEELKLCEQVRFVGRVSPADLAALYGAARLAVLPTLFEAGSFPVLEAFSFGVPVACSRVTSLPEIVGDAALLFDPQDVSAIALAMCALDGDAALRERLATRGRGIVSRFTWRVTADSYRALYRALCGADTSGWAKGPELDQAECSPAVSDNHRNS